MDGEVVSHPAASPPPTSPTRPCSPTQRTKLLRRGARQKGSLLVDLSNTRQAEAQPLLGILEGKFRVAPEEVAALQAQHGVGEEELLARLIGPAAELARPPISSFHVGCVAALPAAAAAGRLCLRAQARAFLLLRAADTLPAPLASALRPAPSRSLVCT